MQVPADMIEAWRHRIRETTLANYHYCMAVAIERDGNTAEALAAYSRSLEIQPTHSVAAHRLHALLVRLGHPNEAESVHQRALAIDANYVANAKVQIARELLETECWQDGEAALQSAIQGDCARTNDLAEACFLLGKHQLTQGKTQPAIESFRWGVQASPNHVPLLTKLGILSLSIDDLECADDTLKKAIEIEPLNAEARYYFAWSCLLMCQFEDAALHFKESIDLGFRLVAHAQLRWGWALQAQGRYEDALRCYEHQPDLEQQSSLIHSYRGLCLQTMGRLEDAVQAHSHAQSSAPISSEEKANSALTYAAKGNWEDAIHLHQESLASDHTQWAVLAFAHTLARAGRSTEAAELCHEAVQLRPRRIPLLLRLLPNGIAILGALFSSADLPNNRSMTSPGL